MSVGTVSEILSGKRECSQDHLARFVRAFESAKDAQDRLVLAHFADEVMSLGLSPLRFNIRRSCEVAALEEPDEPIFGEEFKHLRQLLLVEAGEPEKCRYFTHAFLGMHEVCCELLARRQDDRDGKAA